MQRAAWQPVTPEAPLLGESVSPDHRQAALLVRERRPSLQVRSLETGSAITALVALPDGSRPFSPPAWDSSGQFIALLYETSTTAGRQLSAFVIRICDQAIQRAQLETIPAGAPRVEPEHLPIYWAPESATLLVVRGQEQQQAQTCFRRSRLKHLGCELVYHGAKSRLSSPVLWSPDGAYVCYEANADPAVHTMAIHAIAKGTTVSVDHQCGPGLVFCFAPESTHLLCCAKAAKLRESSKAAFISVQLATASPLVDIEDVLYRTSIAWGCNDQVAIPSAWGPGIVALYTVTHGPDGPNGLQLVHSLTTAGLVEDVQHSPCGSFLAFLDMGPEFGIDVAAVSMNVGQPENEIVIVHLPTLHTRRFGSRKELHAHGTSLEPRPYIYLSPIIGGVNLYKFPGRGRLQWDKQRGLLAYGPGAGPSRAAGPHANVPMATIVIFPEVKMPCSRLQL